MKKSVIRFFLHKDEKYGILYLRCKNIRILIGELYKLVKLYMFIYYTHYKMEKTQYFCFNHVYSKKQAFEIYGSYIAKGVACFSARYILWRARFLVPEILTKQIKNVKEKTTMADYKQMYFALFAQTSEAIDLLAISSKNSKHVAKILRETQSECESMYVNAIKKAKRPKKTVA